MKRLLVLAVFVQLVSLTRAADCPQALVNGDFELVSSNGECIGWYLPSPYRRENTAGSNGSAGVVLDKLQGTASEYASQRIGLQPGSTYRFGAWVKAEEVSGSGPCFVCLNFYDAAGKWIGESWSSDVRRSTDGEWVPVEGLSKTVPPNTASGLLALCTSKSLKGRFFFDKVFCEKYLRAPVVDVYSSAYRNEAHEGDVSFAAALTPDAFGCPAKDVKAIFAVRGPDGTTFSLDGTMPFTDEARVTMPVTRLAVGKSTVVCALMNGETVIGEAQMTFERLATPSSRKVVIDRYGRAIVDGEPFFPYGMYTGSNFFEGDNFERYCEAPFNCFMEYGHPGKDELDRCAAAGIRSIQNIAAWYSMADKGTNNVAYQMRLQDHPAILGWYLFDEQATSMVPLLRDRYRYVTARDPHHPIWCAQDIFTETRHYIGACDAFGGDPYPISKRPIDRVTEAMKLETRGLMGVRPIWQVVQFFGWNWHDPQQTDQRRPTEAEVRNMTWQAIAGGARGIIYYAYSYLCNNETLAGEKSWDIWEELKRVALEVKRNERILLFAETEAIAEKDLPDGVIGRVFRENGEVWRLLVNTTGEEEHSLGLGALGVSLKRVEAALELTGPYVIDTSTEYSEDVTGSGYFVVTEGATLTLSGKDNSFSGGVIVSNGVVEAKTAKALGTGTVRLEGRAADTCCLKLYPDWTTCNNSVVVGGEARGSSGSNPSIDFVGSTTLGGSISFDPSLAANSSAYINIRVKDDTDNHWATVNGELNAGVGKVQMKGKGNLALNGKVTTSYLALGTSWSDYGSVTLKSSDNEIKEVLLRTYTLTCGAPNVLKGCHFRFYFEDSWSSPRWGSARLNLNGFDQELRDIHSSPDNKISTSLSRTNQNTLWVQNSKNPCTLTFTGSETAYTSGKTYAYFSGPISIVVGGELNPEPGLYQGFLMRPNTMTGSITARKGQARFLASTAGSSEFPNVTNLVVKSGASLSFEASAKKVFTGLRTIEVEEGGKIGVDKSCVEPINSPYAALKLGAKADLRFPNGVTNTVKKAFVNGQQLFPGVYTKALLPDHMANSGDTGALVVLKGPGLELLVR